ncbi:MAG: sulfate adenylyltransferase [Deltaproteobacteria bacterium]|nr:sulfate adenylyltransferase [Deltaproteobacteria bacterium]NIS77211.1 sulfate adenylyltransferase [Deltaproteobacteria bacterium]
MSHTIEPYGGELKENYLLGDQREHFLELFPSLPEIVVPKRIIFDLELLANGGYSPLDGFMTEKMYTSVVDDRHLPSGLPWTIPIVLPIPGSDRDRLRNKKLAALVSESGKAMGSVTIDDIFKYDREKESLSVYRTKDTAHPGVSALYSFEDYYLGGRVRVLPESVSTEFADFRLTPRLTREAFRKKGWKNVVGFQTRNPIHRAHEYIQKVALEVCDGILLHPVVGETRKEDIPADVRIVCYRTLIENYFPKGRILLSVLPLSMRYAGPSEAIHHAIIRRNYGCSHFIVGRDHAGAGDYYGTYDAQKIFDEFDPNALGIVPLFFEHTFFCRRCDGMASLKSCPHSDKDRVILSGTKVREMLGKGEVPPPEFTREEVARILIDSYARR